MNDKGLGDRPSAEIFQIKARFLNSSLGKVG